MMKQEKREQKKKELIETAKDNSELVEFVKSIRTEEIERIKEMRKYNDIEPGSMTWKVAVSCDTLRRQYGQLKSTIQKRLWSIDDCTNHINRLKVQIEAGEITEMLKNGITMNEAELKSHIKNTEWLRDGEVSALYPLLADMRSIVGVKDVARNEIISIEQYDQFVKDVESYVKMYGYNLFEEVE